MRFSKRGKNPLAWGRRAQSGQDGARNQQAAAGDPDLADDASVPEDSGRPTPSQPTPEEGAMATSSASMSAGDPTQQLLAALGRFQRQVARAHDGAPQQIWSDECMNQLIAAVQIAIEQDWQDVVEALTETARVLHTYEQAGQAAHCVDFLADSYEILCLMVGDLLVGRVRPGVLAKWRARYERVVEQLEQEGLELVEDESAEAGAHASPAPPEPDAEAEASPSIHDLPPMTREPDESEEAAPVDEAALDLDVSYEEAGEEAPAFTLDEQAEPAHADWSLVVEEEPAGADSPEWPPADTQDEAPADGAAVEGPSAEVAAQLDTMCDALARIASGEEPETEFYFDSILETLDRIEAAARAGENETAAGLCVKLKDLCAAARLRNPSGEDPFFDLAYAFSGLFAEVIENEAVSASAAAEWTREADERMRSWREAAEAEQPASHEETEAPASGTMDETAQEASLPEGADSAPEPAAPEPLQETPGGTGAQEPEDEQDAAAGEADAPPALAEGAMNASEVAFSTLSDGAATRILRDAESMIREGKAGDAKLMLLKAAAEIARTQAQQAEAEVSSVEQRLQDERNALHQAHGSVSHAESSVTHAEEAVRQSERVLEQRRARTGEVVDERRQTEGRIHELEQRIRDLQEQRKAEVGRLEEIDVTLDGERQKERDAQSDLSRLQRDEEQSRVRLEDVRQEVRSLEQRLTDTEAALERARAALQRQHGSLADIDKTVSLNLSGDDSPEAEEN